MPDSSPQPTPDTTGIRLTSDGVLFWDGGAALAEALRRPLEKAFAGQPAEALLLLAGPLGEYELPDGLQFWREFAKRFLTALCHLPRLREDGWPGALAVPGKGVLEEIVGGAPLVPSLGGLSSKVLAEVWSQLNAALIVRIAAAGQDVAAVLAEIHPVWRLVGRVTLHLAENKRSPEFPFAFLATYSHRVDAAAQLQFLPLSQALKEGAAQADKSQLLTLLTPLRAAAQQSPWLADLIESKQIFQPLAWTPTEAFQFLKEIPTLEEAGLIVRVPDWWQGRRTTRATVMVNLDTGTKTSGVGANALLGFDVLLAIGGQALSDAELAQILASDAPLISLKGQWVEVDREKLAATLALWKKAQQANAQGIPFHLGMRMLSGFPLGEALLPGAELSEGGWTTIAAGTRLQTLLEKLRQPATHLPATTIPHLRATLRPYQLTGVQWLSFLGQMGMGACLADDMGLGKTLQIIALLLLRRATTTPLPSLLIVPASLLGNWKRELDKFSPTLPYLIAHRSVLSATEADSLRSLHHPALQQGALIITTYTTLSKLEELLEQDFDLAILDEAQAIKNAGTTQARTVKRIRARQRIALTGTPIENRLDDLWSLFDFLNPGLLGSPEEFSTAVKSLSKAPHGFAPLKHLIRPYLLRRMKTDPHVAPDLPTKLELTAYCHLNKRQATLYQRAVTALARELTTAEDGIQRQGVILAALMKLKQICNHPSLWAGDKNYAPEDSGKLDRLREIATEIAAKQEKLLIFTQFREMTAPLLTFLTPLFGRTGLLLHGGTPVGKRAELVDQFQAPGGPPFFVISLKAGGSGLNLTAANHVLHFDRWWNPAVEDQATDRAFRIGQHKSVLVHKFVTTGTLEERIDEMIQDKKHLANDLLGPTDGAAKLLTDLTNAELLDFVKLDIHSL